MLEIMILSSAMTLTFICYLFFHFLSFKLPVGGDNNPKLEVMDQDLVDNDFIESGVNEDIPFRNTNDEGEKSSKCNQCNYASSHAGHLKTHLKTHTGEKSNKCNQCDYASSQASNLRTHLKLCILLPKLFDETFNKRIVGKSRTNATMPLLRWDI